MTLHQPTPQPHFQPDLTTQALLTVGPWLQGVFSTGDSHTCPGKYSQHSAWASAPPISYPSLFSVKTPLFHATPIFGGTIILQVVTQPVKPPVSIHHSRLSFLDTCPYPGRRRGTSPSLTRISPQRAPPYHLKFSKLRTTSARLARHHHPWWPSRLRPPNLSNRFQRGRITGQHQLEIPVIRLTVSLVATLFQHSGSFWLYPSAATFSALRSIRAYALALSS